MPSPRTAPSGLPRIRACLFDMDGLLIDTEDIYTDCTNLVLEEYGKPNLPWEIKAKLQGRPGPVSSTLLQAWAQLPVPLDVFKAKVAAHQERAFPSARPLPGVEALLDRLSQAKEDGAIQMTIATSSHTVNYELKTAHLAHIFGKFDAHHVVKGDDPRIPPGRGKPAPDIYLLALQILNAQLPEAEQIYPEECLVFEDSVPGCEAGRRAGMQVAWVPHQGLIGIYQGREQHVLAGLTGEHIEDDDENAQVKAQIRASQRDEWVKAGRTFARIKGATGEIDDGWGRMYTSLENFPLDYYRLVDY